jgi:aryl-alcohol dehydrogenase-like predicted oxidoreductase
MELRPLGNTGIKASVLSLGTVKLGRNQGVKYPQAFDLPSDREARELLACAQGLGINLLDTAPAYGTSEQRLGELMTQRQDWLLCTKVGESFANGHSEYDFRPESVQASVHRSLQRLRTDYLDIVLIHSNGDDLTILNETGTLSALQDLQQQGLIRAVGMSHKTLAGAQQALALGANVLMATLNHAEREDVDLIAQAGAQGCGVLIKKALASGHTPEAERDAALRWVAAQPGVSSVVIGSINQQHLVANAQVLAS